MLGFYVENPLIKYVSFSWIDNCCLYYDYKEERKGEDDEFSCKTDDEGMCILVWFLWYSYAWISVVTYILCLFCWIIEITPQKKMNILSHMTHQKVCQPPPPKGNEAVGTEGEDDESGSDSNDKGWFSDV